MTKCNRLPATEYVKCTDNQEWGWVQTYPDFYIVPAGWEREYPDEQGPDGSHGGCPNCIMTLIKIKKIGSIPEQKSNLLMIVGIVIFIGLLYSMVKNK